jgi:lactoylglutathione lyase
LPENPAAGNEKLRAPAKEWQPELISRLHPRPFKANFIFQIHFPCYRFSVNKVGKLLHTRYRVNDLERTVNFYRNVLGLAEVRRHKSPRGSELVFLKAPGSEEEIEICHFPGSDPVLVQPDLTHLAFEVNSLEEFAAHLARNGLKFSDGPTTGSSGSTFAFVDAPEGYEIELIQKGK